MIILFFLSFAALTMYLGIKSLEYGGAVFSIDWFTGLAFSILGIVALFVGGTGCFFISDYYFYMQGVA